VSTTGTQQEVVYTPEVAALRRENSQLREAVANRAVIEQAKGALIWRFRISDEAAFAVLKRWSQTSNVKLHTVADTLVHGVCRGDTSRQQMSELADWLREQVGEPPVTSCCGRTIVTPD
jgi:ANTAR domain